MPRNVTARKDVKSSRVQDSYKQANDQSKYTNTVNIEVLSAVLLSIRCPFHTV